MNHTQIPSCACEKQEPYHYLFKIHHGGRKMLHTSCATCGRPATHATKKTADMPKDWLDSLPALPLREFMQYQYRFREKENGSIGKPLPERINE